MKDQKLDPATIITPLLASKGLIIGSGILLILFGKELLAIGVLSLIGHLAGKVVKRVEERRAS